MSIVRRLWPAVVLASLGLALSVGVPSAAAIDPFPNTGIASLSSAHFKVYYNQNNVDPNCIKMYITQQTAGDILGMAERAYALYTSWGYSPPAAAVNNISVDDFQDTPPCISNGTIDPSVPRGPDGSLSRWNALVNPSDDEIHLDATTGLSYHTIAHEVFRLFQDAINPSLDPWLQDGSAEWAAFRAESYLTVTKDDLGDPDVSADCVGSECGNTEFDRGYPSWLLFEYLSERFGADVIKAVLTDSGTPGTTKVSDVLAAHGTTLPTFFNDYTTARLTGNFSLTAIQGLLPAFSTTISSGDLTAALPTTNVAVNHLAARYVTLHHGNATDTGNEPCYAATLAINVSIPAGVTSTPYYYANTNGAVAQALSVSGSNASITVPWNTCAATSDAYLSLPNDSLGLDGREFVITGTMTVNLNSPLSPSGGQLAPVVVGPVTAVPTSDPPPTLAVFGPEVLRVDARARVLRFIVYSSGSGKLSAVLGSTDLGSASLRPGNNDVRWKLPASLVGALRRTTADGVLVLTSLSPSGTRGATVTRRVVIVATKKKRKHR